MKTKLSRRSALRKITGGAAVLATASSLSHRLTAAEAAGVAKLKGRINHSVCKWCYGKIPLEDFCKAAREIGLQSVELLNPADFPVLRKYGLTCAMVSNPTIDGLGGITKAFNRVEHHDKLVQAYEQRIKECADAGMTNLICFSGNRDGLLQADVIEVITRNSSEAAANDDLYDLRTLLAVARMALRDAISANQTVVRFGLVPMRQQNPAFPGITDKAVITDPSATSTQDTVGDQGSGKWAIARPAVSGSNAAAAALPAPWLAAHRSPTRRAAARGRRPRARERRTPRGGAAPPVGGLRRGPHGWRIPASASPRARATCSPRSRRRAAGRPRPRP